MYYICIIFKSPEAVIGSAQTDPVVQRLDSAIHQINHFLVDKY